MIDYLEATARNWPSAGVSLLLALLFGGLLWVTHNALTRSFDDRKVLFEDGNVAYLVQRLALVLAFAVASLPTILRGEDEGRWWPLVGQAMELTWVFVALLLIRYVVDFVVLGKVDNTDELLRGNRAVGVAEAGFYVGFGFILNGSLTGASPSLGTGIAATVVYGILGALVVIALWWLHEAVTPGHMRNRIKDGNLTAAYEVAGVLASVGIVVREGVAGDFTGWGDGFVAFFWTVVFAVVTLYVFRWAANRLILRTYTLREIQDRNMAAASAFSAVMQVAVAVSVAAVVRTQL